MFENLSDRLQDVVHKIKGYGKITEETLIDVTSDIDFSEGRTYDSITVVDKDGYKYIKDEDTLHPVTQFDFI